MRQVLRAVLFFSGILFASFSTAAAVNNTPNMSLITTSFLDKGMLPILYTCEGRDISPKIVWQHLPPAAESLVLIVSDPDARGGTFYHWILYNIPKTAKGFPEGVQAGQLPAGTQIGTNSFGNKQYNGPCPPKGSTHTYVFSVYAVNTKLNLPDGADANTVMDAINKHVLQKAELTVIYNRLGV